jgi:hypothetical protein
MFDELSGQWGPAGGLPVWVPGYAAFGLPSHLDRLNGAGLTGLPALGGLKWTSCPFLS